MSSFRCVIDENNNYVEYVHVIGEDNSKPIIEYYELKDNESLLDAPPPQIRTHNLSGGFLKPQWNGKEWIETESKENIDKFDQENQLVEEQPSQQEQLRADVDYLSVMLGVDLQ